MKNLLELRDEIDVIDKQIVALYQQRMQIAGEVAEYKIETGKKVFDKDREMEKLATLSALGDSAFNRHGIRELFEQIMSISRKRQYQLMKSRILKSWMRWIIKMRVLSFRGRRAPTRSSR